MKTATPSGAILIRGARWNNPKNLGLEIPLNRLVVVTAVPDSGKSSLVFDTSCAEGQRPRNMTPAAKHILSRICEADLARMDDLGRPSNVRRQARFPIGEERQRAMILTLQI